MALSRRTGWSLAPPDRVSLNLTLRCNLSCAMCTTCYDAPELSTDEIKGIIDQTAAWGVEVFNPLGGEPFMRADVVEILDYAVRRGFYVTVTTNGTLISERRAEAIARIPVDRLHFIFSLDGAPEDHDAVRGEGTWARAVEGYRRIRRADAAAGHPRRKILANSLLHARNLERFEASLDALAELGFDGVQVLNLFRGEHEEAAAGDLWFRDTGPLVPVAERLARRAEAQGAAGFRIQNTPEELRRIPRYYESRLTPLEAPCWAGWKELYIHADGRAIMCDGNLDFLAGAFGDVRRSTLRQIWRSPELRERRRVVKRCTTPCNQTCYLRPESDSLAELAAEAGRAVGRRLIEGASRLRRRVEHHPDAVLTLELTDVCPCDWPGCPTPRSRWDDLVAGCPEPPRADNWNRLRDHHHVDFGRGFMGFEVVRAVVDDLLRARLRFGTLALRWRGEPLIHPEIAPILRFLLDRIHRDGLADRLRVHTDGAFLTDEVAGLVDHPAPQEWVVDLDRGDGAALDALRRARGPSVRLLAVATAVEGLDPRALAARFPDLEPAAGRFPAEGDRLWFRRADHDHHLANARARADLARVAGALGLAAELGEEDRPRRCLAVDRTPTVSWDGKVTLCPWDPALDNRVGEVTAGRLSAIWRGLEADRRAVASRGVPDRPRCRDCPMPWSPNGPG